MNGARAIGPTDAGQRLFMSLLMLCVALIVQGCGGNPDVGRFPDPGHVTVQVRDTLDRPVPGVLCELKTPDLALVWRSGTTGADGRVSIGQSEGGVLPGEYALTVAPPAGYSLGPAQSVATRVIVRSDEESRVLVTLVAR